MTETKRSVVIIDDEAHVRAILRDVLSRMRFEVVGEGCNGLEAVELYHALTPDFMLLDINMPIMTGEEALMVLMPECPEAIIIMLTSMTDQKSVETCLSLGAANYIRKDTSLTDIQTVIRDTLSLIDQTEHGDNPS
jgi:two-component system chemotaxis response regulator CheY